MTCPDLRFDLTPFFRTHEAKKCFTRKVYSLSHYSYGLENAGIHFVRRMIISLVWRILEDQAVLDVYNLTS